MPGIPRQINQLGTLQSHQRTWIKKGTKRWLFGLSLHGLSLLWCCDFRKKNMKQVVWLIMLETVSWRRGSATETTDVLCVLVPRNFINGNGDTWDIHETYINMRCSVGGQLLGDLCQQSFVIRITRLLCNGQPVNQSLAILPSRFLQTCLTWKASVLFYPLVHNYGKSPFSMGKSTN